MILINVFQGKHWALERHLYFDLSFLLPVQVKQSLRLRSRCYLWAYQQELNRIHLHFLAHKNE